MNTITLAKDFSVFPAGRYRRNAKYSGEAFRDDYLWPQLQRGIPVTVILDGTRGFNPSFLEEAFGGLIREHDMTEEQLNKLLTLQSQDHSIELEIRRHISKAQLQKLADTNVSLQKVKH